MSTSFCWELTCDLLVSRPEGVKDSYPFNLQKPEIRASFDEPVGSQGDFSLKERLYLVKFCVLYTK